MVETMVMVMMPRLREVLLLAFAMFLLLHVGEARTPGTVNIREQDHQENQFVLHKHGRAKDVLSTYNKNNLIGGGPAQNCSCDWLTFYNFDDTLLESGSINFIFTNDNDTIYEAARLGVKVLYATNTIMWQGRASGQGLVLNPDYASVWKDAWTSTISPLVDQGMLMGTWLGDEPCWNGVTHANLTAAADLIRSTWPQGIMYYNEAEPVVTQDIDLYGRTLNFTDVPTALDWFSIDYYQTTNSSWEYPMHTIYPDYIYPKMYSHQCALTVPGSYGSNCSVNSAGAGNWTLDDYEDFMSLQALEYYQWAMNDSSIIGMAPWYWNSYSPYPYADACNASQADVPFEVATNKMPSVADTWYNIGNMIALGDE